MQPIDLSTLSQPAQKIAGPGAPQRMQEMAARGIAPGVRPGEMIAILVLLASSTTPGVPEIANKTLGALPDQLVMGALGGELAPAALHAIAVGAAERLDVLERVFMHPSLHPETVEALASIGSEQVTELIATNEERLLANPVIIEKLYMNKRTRMSTADRLIELAVRNGITLSMPAFREAAIAIQNELIMEASEEPTPDDLLFKETRELADALTGPEGQDTHDEDEEGNEQLKDKFVPVYVRFQQMTPSQKIRLAQVGTREERMFAVRDSNRMVSAAAVRSPLMAEDEAVLISRNRNMSDEVLRVIGSTPEWTKSYTVKKNLVENPKTPVMISQRLVTHLREADLKVIAKSKNVTGPVQDAARRHLERRKS